MKNIVLVTHGEFATGILSSLNLIYGEVNNLATVTITATESMEEIQQMISNSISSFKNNFPTVIITDITNGSTSQAALNIMKTHSNIYLLSGLNLGLLLEIILADFSTDYSENSKIIQEVITNSRETINFLNEIEENINISKDSSEL